VSHVESLRSVELFADLGDDDLKTLLDAARPVTLERGATLFAEGEGGDEAFVITDGEIEIVKQSQGRELLLAVRGADDVIGEMALLESAPRMASARARSDSTLLAIPKAQFDHLIESSHSAARSLFGVLMRRWRETESRLRQSERMAQLGTLTAGLAHEINNPAAAVQRAAGSLAAAADEYTRACRDAAGEGITDDLAAVLDRIGASAGPVRLDPITRSDAEADLEAWLTDRGVAEPWTMAAPLVEAGVTHDDITGLGLEGSALAAAVRLITAAAALRTLIHQVAEGSRRVFEIVRVLKGYSFLDEAPIQDVMVTDGIDDTLLLLRSKIGDIEVIREYGDLPEIPAFGSELNQVWTNLIDNAVDAINEGGGGRITVRAAVEDDAVVVEVSDDGPGIPPDIAPRIFDPFFTTKEPGKGTGLGLDITYGIVVHRHGGEITVREPVDGGTTIRVALPIAGPPAADG
jgi:signal transduction histidine kinase